eukprot:m.7413 g.7413  ORF g.7413 m.7413 type:complete len:347 (+) comp5244_c0_seq2:319-1359(+)
MSSEPVEKRAHTTAATMKIGTHDGHFHCDEALACYMLKQLPEYKDAEIVRTRNPDLLAECDIVVDVGATFDPAKHRYDHHQREFDHTMNSLNPDYKWVTKLSSAGLVYFHFGTKVISAISGETDEQKLAILFKQMYENFVEEVDAVDNGISQYSGSPLYRVSTTVSARVGRLNPAWNAEAAAKPDELFVKAMELVGSEFTSALTFYHKSWLPARSIVVDAVRDRLNVHKSGEVMVLPTVCPWKAHLLSVEEEESTEENAVNIKYVLFRDFHGKWRVMAVPISHNSFTSRKPLPKPWRGIRNDVLSELSGIEGCVFVHAAGFIGGNNTFEGALAMADKALAFPEADD